MARPLTLFSLLVLLLWLLSLPLLPATMHRLEPWPLYLQLLNGSGYVAIALLSLAMVLGLRLPRLSQWLGGLDQAYQVHRRAAEWGIGLALFHYLLKLAASFARDQGWLEKGRGFGAMRNELFSGARHLAKDLGEWGLYAGLLLVAIALLRIIPYRRFAQSHRLLPAVYLLWAFHSLVLMPAPLWLSPTGLALALLLLAGSGAAVWSLSGRVGHHRQYAATITHLEELGLGVLGVRVRLQSGWPGHTSGQFALVTFDSREGAHPFTIASAWRGDGELRFGIKALGDYTRELPTRLKVGDPLWVEGPYGHFLFDDHKPRQIWIGGGIGMTPFIAKLQQRADVGGQGVPVDLFYCTSRAEPAILARLQPLAEAAKVRLHLYDAADGQQLNAAALCAAVRGWQQAGIWFCGPAPFGQQLRYDLIHAGLPADAFHHEAFRFR
ncbi:MAG: ferredoxin reductase family protein [Gammaproteobacteria bacterium]|nr:ferredoxin reductase family protein [Gammaproteobacteria bacterium]